MKVTSTKYGVATLSTTSFRLVDVYMCLIVFTTTIDTMLFLQVFRNFNEVPLKHKMLETAKKNTVPFKLKATVLLCCTVWLMVN